MLLAREACRRCARPTGAEVHTVIAQGEVVVTRADGQGLRQMIAWLRAAGRTRADPYERYVRELQARPAHASVVPETDVPDGVVTMNSEVWVRDVATDRGHALTLSYPSDADPFGERVSVLTPFGGALLGARVNDIVEWPSRRGQRRVW